MNIKQAVILCMEHYLQINFLYPIPNCFKKKDTAPVLLANSDLQLHRNLPIMLITKHMIDYLLKNLTGGQVVLTKPIMRLLRTNILLNMKKNFPIVQGHMEQLPGIS